MQIGQTHIQECAGDLDFTAVETRRANALVFIFGSVAQFDRPELIPAVNAAFPHATVVGCTTAGEITAAGVFDETLTVTTIEFEKTRVKLEMEGVPTMADSAGVGSRLARTLTETDLKCVLVLSDGIGVNGSSLVKGLGQGLAPGIPISGGLAGDGGQFSRTLLIGNGQIQEKVVLAIGLYGEAIKVQHGCVGGWTVFGPRRIVTKSVDNLVYELDYQPILEMYERYLGDEAKGLPGSGLLYPLALLAEGNTETGLIRTLLSINREDGSITFAGDIPENTQVQLMYAQDHQLVSGAAEAASQSREGLAPVGDALSLMVSCVGRKLLLGQKTTREVTACIAPEYPQLKYTGFYSNGEICPFDQTGKSELHNETMTITTLYEA